jgi:glycosyltransferase involved in cell wall biosynthesis
LHIHLPYTAILGRFCAQVAGVRAVVYTEHNVHEMYHPLTRFFNRLTCPLDSATIAVSDEVNLSSLSWKMLRPKRIRTILGGVDLEDIELRIRDVDKTQLKTSLGIPQGHLVVGNVAHIRPEKGQGYLIEAAARVLQQHPGTTFVIVGRPKEGESLQVLVSRATELGIRDHIIFAGSQEDAVRFMSIFDVFVLSSLYEGLPIALLEAMSAGVPPVATAVGGVPEVVRDGVDGFLVEPKKPEMLAQKIGDLLGTPKLRQAMSREAAKRVRGRFSIQAMVEAVKEVYAGVLSSISCVQAS